MKIPANLRHKPVIEVEDYDSIDGKYAYHSDAKGLSLGLAQWNERGKLDVSAKVWRHSGNRWSRQSEELPMHRVLDLAILICKGYGFFQEIFRNSKPVNLSDPGLGSIELQGAKAPISIATDNAMIKEDIQLFAQAMVAEDERLNERFKLLAGLLRDIRLLDWSSSAFKPDSK